MLSGATRSFHGDLEMKWTGTTFWTSQTNIIFRWFELLKCPLYVQDIISTKSEPKSE